MDRYISLNGHFNGPGDARPNAVQILEDEDMVGKFWGHNVLITGGTAGLGKESARVLRLSGAQVWITARNKERGEEVARSVSLHGEPYPAIKVIEMDLADLESVRDGAKDFLQQCSKLNILITNAGIMGCPETRTAQNFELQFGTNHLAHFLLFQLLKPALLSGSTSSFQSRVISISSSGHQNSSIQPGNYNLENAYHPFVAYGQSKTANILMANEIERRYGSQGLHAWSVHPGVIFETELARHQEGQGDGLKAALTQMDQTTTKVMKNVGQGAATQVWAAVAKALEGKGGMYLEDCQVSKKEVNQNEAMGFFGYKEYVYDGDLAKALWNDSCEMVRAGGDEHM